MLVTRKCDRAKGFGVRVDLDVTSDGKSIIIFTQTTILNNSVDFVSKEETFQMWMRRRVSRDAILDLEWRIRVLPRCTGTPGFRPIRGCRQHGILETRFSTRWRRALVLQRRHHHLST